MVVTNFGRGLRLTERAVQRLPKPVPVLEMDITNEEHVATVIERPHRAMGEDGRGGPRHRLRPGRRPRRELPQHAGGVGPDRLSHFGLLVQDPGR